MEREPGSPALVLTRSAWAWSFAAWTLVAFFLSQRWYLSWRERGGGLGWGQSLAYALGDCYLNALVTPPLLVWRMKGRGRSLRVRASVPSAAADHERAPRSAGQP